MTLATIMGTGGHALLLGALILWLARLGGPGEKHHHILAIAAVVVALIPLGPLSAAQFTRGLFGDLSITGILLLGRFLLLPRAPQGESRQLFILLAITGLLFYPAALGLGMTDPYQWGYLNGYRGMTPHLLFLASLAALLLLAWRLENSLIIVCITVALGAFALTAMESRNLWDYLIDPMVAGYGLATLGLHFIRRILGLERAT